MSNRRIDPVTGQETTGHVWDGIEELNTPLPRWWLWTFYATVLYSVAYVILYPAWPLITSSTAGLTGWSSRAEVAAEIAAVEDAQSEIRAALVETPMEEVGAEPQLASFARDAGAAVFRTHCSQCHGAGAAGAKGYPNLLDDAWIWGGSLDEIAYTVRHGIRNEDDPAARYSEMPAFRDILSEAEITQLAAHVAAFPDGVEPEAGPAGALYADNCAACHGAAAEGNRDLGAPRLSDAIWLYGGSPDEIAHSIARGPYGVMPPWAPRLSEAEIRAVSLYVHGLGGGETAEPEDGGS